MIACYPLHRAVRQSAPFVDLSVGESVWVNPTDGGIPVCATFLGSDYLRGASGSVLVAWVDDTEEWVDAERVRDVAYAAITPIYVIDAVETVAA